MKYRVRIWTGPTEVKQRANYASEGVYTKVYAVLEGTEHIYITLEAPDRDKALQLAAMEAGYEQAEPRKGDCVLRVAP